jgi:predicted regulator of Ras-like GTPase activity (Roadblock/LC7/MglB family)
MSGIEGLVAARISVLMNHGEQNHAALEKGQRKNMCISSSMLSHQE